MATDALQPGRIWLGTCAWSFDDWRDVFYPHDLPRNRWLQFYARHFHAVEMDSSFYHLPSARTVGHWEELAGPGFRFCPKLPKSLSHEKHLDDPAPEIAMMRRLAGELGPHMGCALLQLPPSFHARPHEEKMLRAFLRAWPDDIPLAVEFRHESWETPHAAHLLEDKNAAWVWADNFSVRDEKKSGFGFLPVTASHLYVRLLGDSRTKYGPDGKETHRHDRVIWPRDTSLAHWTSKLRHHAEAEAVYLFAGNHYEGMAVETARRLAQSLGFDAPRPFVPVPAQLDLFDEAGSR
ncbi:MAG: DUF72 domain-containing protein [Chthoniobacterales bacterium]|jgi:uncharacterized protein YecE (DUF72 family)|nr:DUF72 domain-containing protein [Chthoniobacterales bacterium]